MYYASRGGADAALHIGAKFESREVTVHDARQLQPPASLDGEGFALVPHASQVKDFYAFEPDQEVYEAEIAERVIAASGGTEALVFDHTLRSDSRDIRGRRLTREPAAVIHNDYTDASAVKRLRDLVASERRAKDRVGELELVSWNPDHRWYYYPEMVRNEALLIKTFDSAGDEYARCSIHTAFHNPLAPPDAPARESMESRLLVFF